MVVAPLAIDLFVILACLGALIIILSAKQIVSALFQVGKTTTSWIPWIGKKVANSLDRVEQRLVSSLSDTANGLQGVMGAFWHALGNILSSIGNEMVGLAQGVARLGDYVHGVVRPWVVRTVLDGLKHGVKWLRHELANTKTQVYRVTKVLEHPAQTKIGGAVRAITKPLNVGLDRLQRWTHAQIARLDHAIAVPIHDGIAGLRSRTGALERFYDRLWHQVRSIDQLKAASVAAGIVAVAVARLGFGWVRCSNWRKLGRGVCRTNTSLIDDLLLGTLLVVGTISITEFARELQGEMGPAVEGITKLVRR